ncbi:hypothetical protein CR973_00465 [Candidatus Saccharibacteria bacterium]|nr:MAG: hypothetical protein CR973_00465 [Candidatus Saccharibacteria bacterium]
MLVGEPRKDGSLSAVRAAIRAGGSVIAIVENKTRDPYNSERYDTESFSFVRLGLGHNKPSAEGEDSIGTGFVVDTVSRDELTQPGPSSVIEPKKVTLTRENFGGDPQVSREHCSVTFDPTLMGGTGDIVVRDGNEAGRASTNGTYLVTAETYNGGREITGEEASLYGVLKENPGAWDPKVIAGIEKQAQGRHVPIISPQG